MQNAKITTKLESEEDYEAALREIEPYFQHEPVLGTPDAARFNELADMLRAYEAAHWPIINPVHKQ